MSSTAPPSPDAKVAWQLCIELTTRVTTQPLPLLHGDEVTALTSVADFFKDARRVIAENPGCHRSAELTIDTLNRHVRPFTAKWHRQKETGRLHSTDQRFEFRAELIQLQQHLRTLAEDLAAVAGMQDPWPWIVNDPSETSHSSAPLPYGIPKQKEISTSESRVINNRRRRSEPETEVTDAIGLALSGGGIRSATFSLGVLQALAAKVELRDIDLMSTVSGGGYLGCFLATHGLNALQKSEGKESTDARHLRNHSKYLMEGRLPTVAKKIVQTALLGLAASVLLLGGPFVLLWDVLHRLTANPSWLNHQNFWWVWTAALGTALLVRLTPAYPLKYIKKLQSCTFGCSVFVIIPKAWTCINWPIPPSPLTEVCRLTHWWSSAPVPQGLIYTVLLILVIWAWLHIDLNVAGPHHYYRQRLAKTFLKGSENLPLSELQSHPGNSDAPYLLINTALNVPGSDNEELRGRDSDLFVLSPLWCGSAVTGWRKTSDDILKNMTLATAMTVSAAAISPRMGTLTRQPWAFFKSLLGGRLGYWLRWPEQDNKAKSVDNTFPALICLLRELTGWRMNENQHWLNLSDGGHIENLGVYELLRRRCRYVIAIDGGHDPKHHFGDLLNLTRMAMIDLGVTIEPNLSELKVTPQGLSNTHFAMATITYPENTLENPTKGLLLYVKLSMTGDESEYLRKYRLEHPTFPHESTAQQLFSEQQFEAYRALGEHIGNSLFSPALVTGANESATLSRPIAQWLNDLAQKLLPVDRAV